MILGLCFASPAPGKSALETDLKTSNGETVSLSRFLGKPTLVFYEDKNSTPLNRPLKSRLREWGSEHEALGSANVIAVANLKAYNFFPVRGFALRHVRELEQKVGIPIFADLDGALSEPPWSLPKHSSTVVLFDRSGNVVYEKSGALSEPEITMLLDRLGTLLAN